jgi:protein SCO1/2
MLKFLKKRFGTSVFLAGMLLLVSVVAVHSQLVRDSVPELMSIDIIEHLGDKLPLQLEFTDDNGNAVRLADYFGNEKPVALILGYYECPMLCNLVFNGISDGIKGLQWVPGEKYEIINVSIDPLETVQLARAKKANYIKSLEMTGAENGWHFLIGDKSQSEALAQAVGFKYYYVEERDEYAHPAAAYVISPDGTISRYLYGVKFTPHDLKMALLEASEGKIGSTLDRVILYCFHYDPESKAYVLFAQNVMKIGGLLTVIIFSVFLGSLWLKDQLKPAEMAGSNSQQLKSKV